MPDLYPLLRAFLFRLPPETANTISLYALRSGLGRIFATADSGKPDPPLLQQRLWGFEFPNPIGLAAGCDKDARAPNAMLALGFGFVEIGTVTPRPQPGNPKPRLFRLDEDRAGINRLGFNSDGLDAVIARLSRRSRTGIIGVNLGKNWDSAEAVKDYEEGVRRAAPFTDYIVINISSPNTPGLRDLQARARLDSLLWQLVGARNRAAPATPLLLKIAPDLTAQERADIAEISLATRIDGLVVSNTTLGRPPGLRSRYAGERGGLSGRPLFNPSTALLADMYQLTKGKLPLIGVGGVGTAADAYAKIRAGASLVQLYTALVFEGPALVSRIKTGLVDLLVRDGFASLSQAVGSSHRSAISGAGPLPELQIANPRP